MSLQGVIKFRYNPGGLNDSLHQKSRMKANWVSLCSHSKLCSYGDYSAGGWNSLSLNSSYIHVIYNIHTILSLSQAINKPSNWSSNCKKKNPHMILQLPQANSWQCPLYLKICLYLRDIYIKGVLNECVQLLFHPRKHGSRLLLNGK